MFENPVGESLTDDPLDGSLSETLNPTDLGNESTVFARVTPEMSDVSLSIHDVNSEQLEQPEMASEGIPAATQHSSSSEGESEKDSLNTEKNASIEQTGSTASSQHSVQSGRQSRSPSLQTSSPSLTPVPQLLSPGRRTKSSSSSICSDNSIHSSIGLRRLMRKPSLKSHLSLRYSEEGRNAFDSAKLVQEGVFANIGQPSQQCNNLRPKGTFFETSLPPPPPASGLFSSSQGLPTETEPANVQK